VDLVPVVFILVWAVTAVLGVAVGDWWRAQRDRRAVHAAFDKLDGGEE